MKYLEDSHNYRELTDQIFYACPTAGRDGGLARNIRARPSNAHRVGAANKTNQQSMQPPFVAVSGSLRKFQYPQRVRSSDPAWVF
jgi:hypothetical protein